MGTVISKAANGVGGALGSAFVAPIKTIFGDSCQYESLLFSLIFFPHFSINYFKLIFVLRKY